MIEVSSFSKTIRGHKVLREINLTVRPGEIVGVKGPNGSGKTMLLRAIAGLVYSDAGAIFINGIKLGPGVPYTVNLGLLIETPSFLAHYTGLDNCRLLASIRNTVTVEDIKTILRQVGLDPQDRRPFHKYSLGMKQRLGLAVAFMERPDVVLLDEPTNALDQDGVEMFKSLICKARGCGASIVITSHDDKVLGMVSDRMALVEEGRLIEEKPPMRDSNICCSQSMGGRDE